MRLSRAAACAAATLAILGPALTSASAAPPPPPPDKSCADVVSDSTPRLFNLRSTDPAPAGGAVWGYVWQNGFTVCVGHISAPYDAGVKDYDGGSLGAAAIADFDEWNGSAWVHRREVMATAKGVNAVTAFSRLYNLKPVNHFKVGICLYDSSGNGRYCDLEG